VIEIKWDAVRLPGVFRPSSKPPYRFELKPASPGVARAAFDGKLPVEKSSLLCISIHSPTSKAMYPDIVRGDFGFPTVGLKNGRGTIYRFARGNLKDFFDISRPNEPQSLELPADAFVYDSDLKTNVPEIEDDERSFFDYGIVGIYFDHLCHPTQTIDIQIGAIGLRNQTSAPSLAVQDLLHIERVRQTKQLPPPTFSTDSAFLTINVALNEAGKTLGYEGSELVLRTFPKSWKGRLFQEKRVTLKGDAHTIDFSFREPGHFTMSGEILRDGKVVASSTWPACKALRRLHGEKATILGISDSFEYDRIAAAGGTWDRLPVPVKVTERYEDGTVGFTAGNDPIPQTRPLLGKSRVFAAFAMPKWLSRLPERWDYDRYAPNDWDGFRKLVTWLATKMKAAGATHYEVWNESSVIGHWNDDMPSLVELHRVTYEAVKAVDPNIVVLGGCTHSWTFDFLRKFLEAGGAQHCDGLAIHGYTYQPWEFQDQFDTLDRLIAEYAPGPNFKAYITEIGFRAPAFSLDDQAKFLALYTLEAASRATIGAILWFRFTNPRPEVLSGYRQNSAGGYALVGHNGSYCRPSFAAYRFVERLLQQFDEIRASGPGTARRYEFVRNGSVEAVGLYRPQGEPDLPAGWTVLDQYGAPLEGHADLRVAVSPRSAHLLR
jgi:hypothetical protein